eukprot:2454526-Pyramimonas_sp.AAC.1
MKGGAKAWGKAALPFKIDEVPLDRQSFLLALLTRDGGTIVDKGSVLHYAVCAEPQCARCKYVVHADAWKKQLPLGGGNELCSPSWLKWQDHGA